VIRWCSLSYSAVVNRRRSIWNEYGVLPGEKMRLGVEAVGWICDVSDSRVRSVDTVLELALVFARVEELA
jgi:hypothetical protein